MTLRRASVGSLSLVILLGLVLIAAGFSPTLAARRSNIVWLVDCNGFTSDGGGIYMDRDNTGTGRETIIIRAVDGAGRVIFGPVEETTFVGLSLDFPQGVRFLWSAEPTANPLRVSVLSKAGNGLGEQLVYEVDGICGLLPIATNPAVVPTLTPVAVPTAPTVDIAATTSTGVRLNAPVPYPVNPPGISAVRDGYLIVNAPNVNLRSGDGTRYTIVGRVIGGQELIALGVNPARTWWFVEVGPIRGWINNTLVINRGDLTNVPVIEARGEIFPPRFYLYRENNLYRTTSERSTVVCIIDGDFEYLIVGRNRDASWLALEVVCAGQEIVGWIRAENGAIRNSGDLSIPIIPAG